MTKVRKLPAKKVYKWRRTGYKGLISEKVDYDFWYLSPRVGYLWYPFRRKRLYVLGEVVGIVPVTGSAALLEDSPIEINPFIPLPGLGIGFRF